MTDRCPDPYYNSLPAEDLKRHLAEITGYQVEVNDGMPSSAVEISTRRRVVTFQAGMPFVKFQWGLSRARLGLSCGFEWVPELKPNPPRLAVVTALPAAAQTDECHQCGCPPRHPAESAR